MTERFTTPTPRDLAARSRRPEVLTHPVPAPGAAPGRAAGEWSRDGFESAVRVSELHPNARLVAFLLAQLADATGFIAAENVPERYGLARAANLPDIRVRRSLASLTERQWMTRAPYDSWHQRHGAITLTIPAGRPQPRAR